jgi:hypothetical protein
MGASSVCRGCGGTGTVRAHLIPRSFVHDLKGAQKHIYVGWAERKGRKVSQSGLIDEDILCGKCDGHLGQYDAFAIEFCRNFDAEMQTPAPNIFRISPADTEKAVKFFASVVWRYSISTLPEAAEVNLGSFEDTFKDILLGHAPCAPEPATVLFRYRSRVIKEDEICLPPFKSPFIGGKLEAYSIALGGFRALVKVDATLLPPELTPLTINGKSEITGGYLDFEATQEFGAIREIVEKMQQKP